MLSQGVSAKIELETPKQTRKYFTMYEIFQHLVLGAIGARSYVRGDFYIICTSDA